MCGRFNLAALTWSEVWHLLTDGTPPPNWLGGPDGIPIPQRFNTAPTQMVPTVHLEEGELKPALARWGLIPRWFRKPLKEWKANTINARVETVAEAPSFRAAYRTGRSITPMSGYYEWATRSDAKQPWYIHPAGNEPGLLVCGLTSWANLPNHTCLSCTILTQPAFEKLAAIHDRQPVIVDADGAHAWLEGARIEDVPRFPNEKLVMHKVSKRVNNWRVEDPGLIEPDDGATQPRASVGPGGPPSA